jgi:phosphohistidine phosphatase
MIAVGNDRLITVGVCEQLAPDSKKRKLLRKIISLEGESIGLVGHNPDLSDLAGWLLGEKETRLNLEKAGVACIQFDGAPAKGAGSLVWLVTPAWCELVAGVREPGA